MSQSDYEVADNYVGLREQVLQITADSIGRTEADPSTVIAVLMEIGYPEVVVTLVAVSDGAVSLYFGTGGGIIGCGEHEAVREVAGGFITLSQQFVSELPVTDTFPLPRKGNVRCYLVTPGGVYTFEAPEEDLGYERHPCSPLFHRGHELITAIRENTRD